MGKEFIYKKLISSIPADRILRDEPMAGHTTFRIGGPADFFVCPQSAEELADLRALLNREGIPSCIIGNGSNLLVGDQGYRGVIVQVLKELNTIAADGEVISAGAGALLSAIASEALTQGLTGFEFASGIPGTLGGACVMNAGAYGGEMKDVLTEVTVVTGSGEILTLPAEDLALGYRTSIIPDRDLVVVSAKLRLHPGERDAIRSRMDELREQRTSKQPLTYPSAGSTFKRPEGYFAGKLIMDAGLAGFRVGDACVSEKHCGFVVNLGQATAADVRELIDAVTDRVYRSSGVTLVPEVKFLGEF